MRPNTQTTSEGYSSILLLTITVALRILLSNGRMKLAITFTIITGRRIYETASQLSSVAQTVQHPSATDTELSTEPEHGWRARSAVHPGLKQLEVYGLDEMDLAIKRSEIVEYPTGEEYSQLFPINTFAETSQDSTRRSRNARPWAT